MRFREFTNEQIKKALTVCSNSKGKRCSNCPIFGKGFEGMCSSLLMNRAAKLIGDMATEDPNTNKYVMKVEIFDRNKQLLIETWMTINGTGFKNAVDRLESTLNLSGYDLKHVIDYEELFEP